MAKKDNGEFPYRGVNKYLDKVYAKIDALKGGLSYLDFEYLTRTRVNEKPTIGDKRRFIREMGFEIGDGDKPCVQTTPFKRSIIKNLYLALHIDPGEFLIDEEFEKAFLKLPVGIKNGMRREDDKYFTREFWDIAKVSYAQSPLIQVKSIPLQAHTEEETDLTQFYKEITPYYRKAHRSITAHEVLFKGNNNNPSEYRTYRYAQNQIFEAIDQAVENCKQLRSAGQDKPLEVDTADEEALPDNKKQRGTFTYQRVFYLSASESIHAKNIQDPGEMFKIMMIEASFETLKHIKDCLEKNGAHIDEEICKFYVAPFSGLRAHTLIDDKWLISEDYKKHADYIKPHILFIEDVEVKSDLQKMKELFDLELQQKADKKIYPLRKKDFPRYIRLAVDYLKERIDEAEDMLAIMDGINSAPDSLEGRRQVLNEKTDHTEIRVYNIDKVTFKFTERLKFMIEILKKQYLDVSQKRDKLAPLSEK
ncbi:MAG: hypothetical protein R2824_02345 [Saprospiraceae bacterium]|nr:hypothetical protein [Lewinella sp.]